MVRKNWNEGWHFTKSAVTVKEDSSVLADGEWEDVELPHTWNGKDGQDGGSDYYRGTCYYEKKLSKSEMDGADELYIEFEGANSSADVYVNGRQAGHHDGGYSTWRVNVTDLLTEENEIVVSVDNAPNKRVYPQQADFTFYGGLYRDVNLLCVGKKRFNVDYYSGPGVKVTPSVKVGEPDAEVCAEAYFTGTCGTETVTFTILDGDEEVTSVSVPSSEQKVCMKIPNVHLWNGRKDPHLYTMHVTLTENGQMLDERSVRFGCRTFYVDPELGFILNGKEYPLHGVSRHQDRPGIGNAIKKEHHAEDIDLIMEMGANTIRLAHYQHNQVFYDLCDEKGLVIWAEIPYISVHMPTGRENTISQMSELVTQNYNHPCICFWGLSNEISTGGSSDDLLENHHILNDMVHKMDPTRLTTEAVVSACSIDDPYVHIPDLVSYNHYFGWYGGDTSTYGEFFDNFHEKYPYQPIGLSEYGAEALNWHTSHPEQGDYTEEYQAHYHEEVIKQVFTRPYIWATHVWNMFDFAADARAEGGEDGMNHKGLVTFDRKYKKDAFYAYKAWLSDEPFVHVCGKRYVDRVEDVTKVTVYSNQPEVELFANGVSLGKQTSDVHFFYFDVPIAGEVSIEAKAGDCTDTSTIRKVEKYNEDYIMKGGAVLNWYEIDTPEGYFSINDKLGDIMDAPEGEGFLGSLMGALFGEAGPSAMGMEVSNDMMMNMIKGFPVKRILSMSGSMGGKALSKEDMLEMNKQLNKIKRP